MSYAVVRMAKMKSHDLKGIQFHNQRERESKTNPDIDHERTKDNYDLINDFSIDYNKRVKEIIESQKTGNRKTRKDAVLVNEFIITSDSEFFKDMSESDTRLFFYESAEFFEERYGKQNIAYGVVHVDEATPHMHLGVVPMRDGKLQGKNVFNRKELLALQEEFPKHMQEKGFSLQRGERGSDRRHLDTAKFKLEKAKEQKELLEKEVQDIAKEKENLEQEKKQVLSDIKTFKEPKKILDNVRQNVEYKTTGGVFKEKKEVVVLSKDDYERLTTLAESEVKTKAKLNGARSKNKILEDEIQASLEREKATRIENIKLKDIQQRLEKDVDRHKTAAFVYKSRLEDLGIDREITDKEIDGRIYLAKAERGDTPNSLQEGQKWLKILTDNKNDNTIAQKRLEGVLRRLKEFVDNLLNKERKFSLKSVKRQNEQIKSQPKRNRSWDMDR